MKNRFLFCTLLFAILCFCISQIVAQTKPDMKMVKEQMKRAQYMIDSIKAGNPDIQRTLDAYKKQQPGLQKKIDSATKTDSSIGDIKLSNMPTMPAMPNFEKLNNTLAQSQQSIGKLQSAFAESNKKGLPQKSNSPFTSTASNKTEITKWATAMYIAAKAKAGTLFEPLLKNTYYDTTQNAASTGMIMIAAGLPKCMGQYLVCKYILDHPKNAMALNDLGIFMRIENDYPKAIALFLYAHQINDSSEEIKTNLAWAYAYAGDFSKAKIYFNEVLQVYPDYGSALEGLSLIAYQEGDRQTLWNNLAKQLLNNNKNGGQGIGAPSGQMASFCGGVLTEEELSKMTGEKDEEHANNNKFNNSNGADAKNQSDEKSIDIDEDIDYPSYQPDFPTDFKNVTFKQATAAVTEYGKAIQRDQAYLISLLATLPKPMQFINSDGDLETIYSYSTDAHYLFFSKMHIEYEKRVTRVTSSSQEKISRAFQALNSSFNGVMLAYIKAQEQCSKDPDCIGNNDCGCLRSVKCDYLPKLASTLKNFGMSIGDITTKGLQQMENNTNWYINASSPMLQFIGEPHWNKYLNAVREADIRRGKLLLMQLHQNVLKVAESYVKQAETLESEKGNCVFEARILQQSIKSKYKQLKTMAPPCKDFSTKNLGGTGNTGALELGPLSYEDNCNHSKLSINLLKFGKVADGGIGKLGAETKVGAFWEKMKTQFVETDYTRTGIEVHTKVVAEVGGSAEDGYSIAKLKTSASLKMEIETNLDFFRSWDANGHEIKRGVMFDASAKVSGSAGVTESLDKKIVMTDNAKMDVLKQGFEKGIKASGEYAAVMGPNGELGKYGFENVKVTEINK